MDKNEIKFDCCFLNPKIKGLKVVKLLVRSPFYQNTCPNEFSFVHNRFYTFPERKKKRLEKRRLFSQIYRNSTHNKLNWNYNCEEKIK